MKTVRSFYDKYHMEIGNIVLIMVLAIALFPRLSADYVLHQFVIIVLLTMGLSIEMLSGVLDFAFTLTLHLQQLAGKNSHHIIEGAFKSVARSLRPAVAIDPRFPGAVPSTKGVL